ncbi:NADPH:quinone oxidoreductase family protein [Phreatobacter aquaticus]|uniref:NADPH:quinone oxidoreductase family protein n=1 Tax=Phreatobacter aquaticus TaxID=2570229 RepID=A0A4D7QAL1_9HYPH|nr:NADPH:quinone oxidoreductase family protein [Phreatobacter aquaticus]QCK85120.1 NADPH:quinone oxidoreductase family protein [Phreatobacter aquaticus]
MKAVLCKTFGPPESLVIEEMPDPVAGPGEVVVAVTAVGLNFFDNLVIKNMYQIKPPMPFSPCSEFAGRVASLGEGVTRFKVGDRVAGNVPFGAARTHLVAKAAMLAPIPSALTDDQAAGLVITYGTTIHALKDRAKLQPGETLAVLGAAGGVGLAAIELGKAMGARVIACASSPEKLAFCKAHGADEVIDYSKEDLKERLRALTDGKGVDVVYDPVGDKYAEPAIRALAWEGRYLVIGFAGGEIPKIPLNLTLLKSSDIRGVFWGEYARRNPEANAANLAEVARLTAEGKLSLHVHATYPLERIADGLNELLTRKAQGKVILKP